MVRSIKEGGQDGCWLKELELVDRQILATGNEVGG